MAGCTDFLNGGGVDAIGVHLLVSSICSMNTAVIDEGGHFNAVIVDNFVVFFAHRHHASTGTAGNRNIDTGLASSMLKDIFPVTSVPTKDADNGSGGLCLRRGNAGCNREGQVKVIGGVGKIDRKGFRSIIPRDTG